MAIPKDRPKLYAFCHRLVLVVTKLCGEITALTVDTLLSTMTRSMVRETVQRIRRLLKDPAFLAVVNELNLSAGPIKDPKAAEKALSDRLSAPGMAIWAFYAEPTEAKQPTEAQQQFVRVGEQDVLRDGRIKTRPGHWRRLISSGQEGEPPYSAKREGARHRPRLDDTSGGGQTEEQPTTAGPGEEWVRPYKQHRHGKLYPIGGYVRHHAQATTERDTSDAVDTSGSNHPAGSSTGGRGTAEDGNAPFGSDDPSRDRIPGIPDPHEIDIRNWYTVPGSEREFQVNSKKGYDDAYEWLKSPERNPESLTIGNPEFLEKHPGYKEGYFKALDEIKRDPDFKRGLQEGLNGGGDANTGDPFHDMGVLVGKQKRREEHPSLIEQAKEAISSVSDRVGNMILGMNLEGAGFKKPGSGYEQHHIVPQGSNRAELPAARKKLEDLGIKLHSKENGMWLKKAFNRSLNNPIYDNMISERILKAPNDKEAVVKILADIMAQLKKDPSRWFPR